MFHKPLVMGHRSIYLLFVGHWSLYMSIKVLVGHRSNHQSTVDVAIHRSNHRSVTSHWPLYPLGLSRW